MRKKIVAGNWKMNKTPSEAVAFINELKSQVANTTCDVIVCPTSVCLPAVVEAVKGTNIKVGAQNLHFEESGAFTGEISASMLTDIGVEYVIIGHSERRQYFGETDITVNKKVHTALKHGLKPIVCVGEVLEQREQGITNDLLRIQTRIALMGLDKEQVKNIVIAYEPVWAIGTGKTASNEDANNAIIAIRGLIAEVYGKDVADVIRIQYGGSVKASNAKELFAMSDIDGGLVGGASLKADEFGGIVG